MKIKTHFAIFKIYCEDFKNNQKVFYEVYKMKIKTHDYKNININKMNAD